MASLASVATNCINDLYARPSSAGMRSALSPLIEDLEEVYSVVEATGEAAYHANVIADEMVSELYKIIDFKP